MTLAVLLLVDLRTGDVRPVYPQYVAMILLHPRLLRTAFGVRVTNLQVLWVSLTLFLHPFGVVYGVYEAVWWYDHLTHVLSASLVASVGYVVGRVVVLRSAERSHSALLLHLGTLLLVLVGGAFWEAYEVLQVDVTVFGIDLVKGSLTVYGTDDTLYDYLFNLVGWLLVVVFGEHLLGDAARDFARQLDGEKADA